VDSLVGIDWRAAWQAHNRARPEPGDSACWDARSESYREHSCKSPYAATFLSYLGLSPGESVLDMGSGPGVLAIPLARAGHPVIAADFSAGMREAALARAEEEQLDNIQVKALDWNEDWIKAGILPKSVDVAIASRSTMVDDLADAFLKLDRTARSKVALTMVTEYEPKGYKPLGSEQGSREPYVPDFVFGVNLLLQLGAYPELRYINITQDKGQENKAHFVSWAYIAWKPITKD
jgi:SAM-dependent methyltransferase